MLPIKIHFPRWLKFQTWLSHLKILWSMWDLRTLLLLSLGLQIFLILFAPFRKKTANLVLVFTIWLGYLMADYVAIQAIGLIPNYSITHVGGSTPHPDLLAFWAPFLLVHLGGPDPITALALEDNELWLRTTLHLLTYTYATGRVFFQALPTYDLFIPTMLMFFAGFLKYLERTLSMYYARLAQFRTSVQQDEVAADKNKKGDIPTAEARISVYKGERLMSNIKIVRDAFQFFQMFMGVYVELPISWPGSSRDYFLDPSLTSEQAFTIIEMEINFVYKVFFTRMVVIHKKFGIIIRFASFIFQVVSLVVWILFIDKQTFHRYDIWITYILLVGAIFIDSIAFLMVSLSDWNVAMLNHKSKRRASLYNKLLSARTWTWGTCRGHEVSSLWLRWLLFRRCSESIYQSNLLEDLIKSLGKSNSILQWIKEKCGRLSCVSGQWFANDLRDFIFKELKCKAQFAKEPIEAKKLCESRGEWVLNSFLTSGFDSSIFNQWITEVEYDRCLLIWHIATEILYQEQEQLHFEEKMAMKEKEKTFCRVAL